MGCVAAAHSGLLYANSTYVTYTYNKANRPTKEIKTVSSTTTYTYNLVNQLTNEARTQSGSTSTATYTYDRNGALTRKDTGTAATTINYSYNSFGELEQVSVGGVKMYYDYVPVSTQSRPPGRLCVFKAKKVAPGGDIL